MTRSPNLRWTPALRAGVACTLLAAFTTPADLGAAPTLASARARAARLDHAGDFASAAQVWTDVHRRSGRAGDQLRAAQSHKRAMQLDDAELAFRAVRRDRSATRAQRHQAWLGLHELTLARQALAKARIDAREHAAKVTSTYFLDHLRMHNEQVARQEAQLREEAEKSGTQRDRRPSITDPEQVRKASLVALTVSGLMLVGKALLTDDKAQDQRGMMLLTGGVVAGVGTALLVASPRKATSPSR